MRGASLFGVLTHVKGIWTLHLVGKPSSSCHISHLFLLNFGSVRALLGMLCWVLKPAEASEPGPFPHVYEFVLVLPLCQWALVSKRSLTLALITEEEALPWHHFDTQVFLIQARGELLQLKPKCLQFSA